MLFEAQCRRRSGDAGPSEWPLLTSSPDFPSWADVVVSEAKENLEAAKRISERAQRARQVSSAFSRLSKAGLAQHRKGVVIPFHESGRRRDGSSLIYTVPAWYESPPGTIELPVEFFTSGWIYVLTPSEIRMYLSLRHLAGAHPDVHKEQGVYFSATINLAEYNLTRDVYESHLTLSTFGLVRKVRDARRHPDGKVVNFAKYIQGGNVLSTHRFMMESDFFVRKDALARVKRGLMNYHSGIPKGGK
jgi:hypothetical protein